MNICISVPISQMSTCIYIYVCVSQNTLGEKLNLKIKGEKIEKGKFEEKKRRKLHQKRDKRPENFIFFVIDMYIYTPVYI